MKLIAYTGAICVVLGLAASGCVADASTPSDEPDVASEDALNAVRTGVFGGGPFYSAAATVVPMMRSSGFSTMVLWTIHVRSNGDLVFNDTLIASGGKYVGKPEWPGQINGLKKAPTSVRRVELAVGSAGVGDFETIEQLMNAHGTGPSSILRKNFQALKHAMPVIDAIDYDDESNFRASSTVRFSLMLADLGYKVTLCPYDNPTFWRSVAHDANKQRPGLVDRVYVQAYAGGTGNEPAEWNSLFPGLKVEMGLWSRHGAACSEGDAPSTVHGQMSSWRGQVAGGWMWLLDDMLACKSHFPIKAYASAIKTALQ